MLALRQALDESQVQLRSAGGEAASLQATIRRHERTEHVLKESLLAAQKELGLTQSTASNLHELLAGVRRTAAADRAASMQDREARQAAEARATELAVELQALQEACTSERASFMELTVQFQELQVASQAESARVSCFTLALHGVTHMPQTCAGC